MKRFVGVILIVFALLLGFEGIRKLDNSGGEVRFLGIRISAEDEGAKETAYVMIGLAVISLAGGIMMLNRGRLAVD